jgi:hypothetical protein
MLKAMPGLPGYLPDAFVSSIGQDEGWRKGLGTPGWLNSTAQQTLSGDDELRGRFKAVIQKLIDMEIGQLEKLSAAHNGRFGLDNLSELEALLGIGG